MEIEIKNLTKFRLDRKSFSQVAKKVLSGENRGTETLSLVLVSKKEIQKLNKKFRKKNKPTDVLSFNLDEGKYLGEIVICPDMVKPNKSQRHFDGPAIISAKPSLGGEDFARVFIHGILHLLGYDHEKSKKEAEIMDAKQNLYLSKIK